jgi:hypothetical protein
VPGLPSVRSGDRIPAGATKFYLLQKRPYQRCGSPSPLFNAYVGSFAGIKRPGRQADHSPPSSAEVKNEWSYTASPPTCFHGVDRDSFTFTLPVSVLCEYLLSIMSQYTKVHTYYGVNTGCIFYRVHERGSNHAMFRRMKDTIDQADVIGTR